VSQVIAGMRKLATLETHRRGTKDAARSDLISRASRIALLDEARFRR
jgi:hypothetical protein